jgi:hypothetical protein
LLDGSKAMRAKSHRAVAARCNAEGRALNKETPMINDDDAEVYGTHYYFNLSPKNAVIHLHQLLDRVLGARQSEPGRIALNSNSPYLSEINNFVIMAKRDTSKTGASYEDSLVMARKDRPAICALLAMAVYLALAPPLHKPSVVGPETPGQNKLRHAFLLGLDMHTKTGKSAAVVRNAETPDWTLGFLKSGESTPNQLTVQGWYPYPMIREDFTLCGDIVLKWTVCGCWGYALAHTKPPSTDPSRGALRCSRAPMGGSSFS